MNFWVNQKHSMPPAWHPFALSFFNTGVDLFSIACQLSAEMEQMAAAV